MFKVVSASVIIILGGFSAHAGEREARWLVCPPHYNYCYYETKPIKPQSNQDAIKDIERRIQELNAENDRAWGRTIDRLGRVAN